MTEPFNRREEKALRRRLRNDMPPAEVRLWSKLRGKQFLNRRFRRQYSVGPYCIDFYCPEIKLAIELDGDSHFTDEAKKLDRERQGWIESFGIRFLRFLNHDVYENLDGVLNVIATAIENTPLNPPFPRGEDRMGEARGGEAQTGEDRTGEARDGEDRGGEDRTGEARGGEDRTGEDRGREAQTGEDRLR